jgi:hypothetical protein
LSARAYTISVHGHRVAGGIVAEGADFITELISKFETAWREYGEIIRRAAFSSAQETASEQKSQAAAS